MIYHNTPYDLNKNIGVAYNAFMEILPNGDDYACFKDGDAMFTTDTFGHQLQEIVDTYPECGIFTAVASRIGSVWQRTIGMWNTDDIREHRERGAEIQRLNYRRVEPAPTFNSDLMGGVLIMIRKSTWEKVGKFNEVGLLGVDNDLHRKAIAHNEPVYIMKGVYLYHWYRGGDASKTQHLK